jgi:Tfp pilus assembly protein PilE
MRFRGITLVEILVVGLICAILWAILWPVFQRPLSFTKTSIPPVRYQNVELQTALADLYRLIRKERGTRRNYAKHFKWQKNELKTRKVDIETQEWLTLKDLFQRIENSAQVKFDYLARPYHSGDVGVFIIRDARQKQNK